MQIVYKNMPLKIKAVQCIIDGEECLIINEKFKKFKNKIKREFMNH